MTVIAVTLNAPDDWRDHQALYEYGFSSYEAVKLCETNTYRIPLSVVNGGDQYVLLCNTEARTCVLPVGHEAVRTVIEHRRFEYAPILSGEELGRVIFYCDTDGDGTEEEIDSVPLYASYTVEPIRTKKGFWKWLCSLLGF